MGAYGEIGVHVVKLPTEGASQVGSKEGLEVVLQTEYSDTETCKGSYDALPGATHHHMGCLREVLVMEGGVHDAALAAPEVALADHQVVAQSPL